MCSCWPKKIENLWFLIINCFCLVSSTEILFGCVESSFICCYLLLQYFLFESVRVTLHQNKSSFLCHFDVECSGKELITEEAVKLELQIDKSQEQNFFTR